jgi:hypothetical protein
VARFAELVFKDSPQVPNAIGDEYSRAMARQSDSWPIESVVQHDAQERSIDLKSAIVFDEAEFPELVHEKIDP